MQIIQKIGSILISIIGIIVLAVVFFNPTRGTVVLVDDTQEVRGIVIEFGQKIKNVSLQNQTGIRDEIKNNYEEYLSLELLELWMNDPSQALGRKESNSWPEKIEINSSDKKTETSYEVKGNIIEVSNEGGGIGELSTEVSKQAVTLTLEKINNKWLVSQIVTGPVNGVGENWVLSKPNTQGIQFMYPEPFPAKFTSAQAWPPLVELIAGEYSCEEGLVTTSDGPSKRLEKHSIGDREYCVSSFSEGAAGSTYTTYEYTSQKQGDFMTRVVFVLRSGQCGNYNESDKIACETERVGFDIDGLVDRIVSSVRML